MKRIFAAALLLAAAGLGACDRAPSTETDKPTEATEAPVQADTTDSATTATVDEDATAVGNTPAFAVVYPGGELEQEPVMATGASGAGGLVSFRTDADPETIVAFYRERAEGAGLNSVTAMNMGDTRSYGAAGAGRNLQVVASPAGDGRTSVQVTWSAG